MLIKFLNSYLVKTKPHSRPDLTFNWRRTRTAKSDIRLVTRLSLDLPRVQTWPQNPSLCSAESSPYKSIRVGNPRGAVFSTEL